MTSRESLAARLEGVRVVRAFRTRRRDYLIEQDDGTGPVADVVNATSALYALRKVRLMPGCKVAIRPPQIVHVKRTRACI